MENTDTYKNIWKLMAIFANTDGNKGKHKET